MVGQNYARDSSEPQPSPSRGMTQHPPSSWQRSFSPGEGLSLPRPGQQGSGPTLRPRARATCSQGQVAFLSALLCCYEDSENGLALGGGEGPGNSRAEKKIKMGEEPIRTGWKDLDSSGTQSQGQGQLLTTLRSDL